MQHLRLQTYIPLAGSFPLDVLIADVGHLETICHMVELHHGVYRHGCIVGNIIITAKVITGCELQIVHHGCLGEPRFSTYHPSKLHAGKQSPLYSHQRQAVAVAAKTAVCLTQQCQRKIVGVPVAVIHIAIPLHLLPLFVGTILLVVIVGRG